MGYTVYLYIASLGKIQYLDLSSSWTLMQGLMIIRKITSLWNCCFAFIFINNGRCIEITRTKNIRTVCKLSLVILREKVEKCTISFFNFCFFLKKIYIVSCYRNRKQTISKNGDILFVERVTLIRQEIDSVTSSLIGGYLQYK